MGLNLDPACQAAIDLAKRALPDGAELDVPSVMASLYHSTGLKDRLPQLAEAFQPPRALRPSATAKVPLALSLQPVFRRLAETEETVTAERFFTALAGTEAGRQWLAARGIPQGELEVLLDRLGGGGALQAASAPVSAWRASAARREAIEALNSYGRTLTATEPPYKGVVEMDRQLESLVRTLSRMGRKNAIITGPPGCGKTALVFEFARRLFRGDEALPERLRDCDVFELSPSFLRSGASMVGQYDERVKALIEILRAHPKIILFVDEIHSLFRSGMHEKGPFSESNEAFKSVLSRGEITCIGCTTSAEYRHYLEPDKAFARRFTEIRVEPPTPEATVRILEARLPRLQQYYAPLRIPREALSAAVDLTEEYLPSRYQPDKSIQLVDEACAYCVTSKPPLPEVTREALWAALEDVIGHSLLRSERLTEESLAKQLTEKIIGQDETMRAIARAFVAGLGRWTKAASPRGVFFFCGPTGVGKTETAALLAKLLGGGRDAMVRVDCNTLQGSGADSGPAINRLLGVPPGYIGYARGQGGLLSRVRDLPESVVLFDEIEKADPGVAKLLLQILDDGRVEDTDGNVLDFRRAFIVFTTNAGCVYDRKQLGFTEEQARPAQAAPRVDIEALKAQLRSIGYGEEFLGRIRHFFVFRSLDGAAIRAILQVQLRRLADAACGKGYRLEWDTELEEHLASRWQPRFGVRHLTAILQNRITEQLSVAGAQGELEGVKQIQLRVLPLDGGGRDLTGLAARERQGETLIINLA